MQGTVLRFTIAVSVISIALSMSQNDIDKIKAGLEFGEKLTTAMKHSGFEMFLGSAGSKVLNFISGTLGFVKAIFSFNGNRESQELLEIKRLYTAMNHRFDALDFQLKDIERQINWTELKLQYSTIEMNIRSNSELFRQIYEAPIANKESEKDYFMHSFESNCYLCATNLYHGIIGENGGFSDDILKVAMTSLQYNRPKTQMFMIGLLKLLILSINNELAYRQFKYGESHVLFEKQKWESKIPLVINKMLQINQKIMEHMHVQAETDIASLSAKYLPSALSNKNFSEFLYNFLVQKYDWRDWLVIVYNPISTVKNHINHVCEGYRRYGMYGRDILVTSVNQTKAAINTTVAESIIKNITTKTNFCYSHPMCYICLQSTTTCIETRYNAEEVYQTIPPETRDCNIYESVGVIDSWPDLHYHGLKTRLVYYQTPGSNSYTIHLFG